MTLGSRAKFTGHTPDIGMGKGTFSKLSMRAYFLLQNIFALSVKIPYFLLMGNRADRKRRGGKILEAHYEDINNFIKEIL